MSAIKTQIGAAAYEDVRAALRTAFPDQDRLAEVTDAMVDATIEAVRRVEGTGAPYVAPASNISADFLGFYVADATHTRFQIGQPDRRVHSFTGHLPVVHVTLPATGMVNISTPIGVVDHDGVLFGSVQLMNDNLRNTTGYRAAEHVELITPPRGTNDERFAAVAVYLLYTKKADPSPSAYVLEAGLAQGGPRIPYYSPDIRKPIPNTFSFYKPTAMSDERNLYTGSVSVSGRELKAARVEVKKSAAASPHVVVEVDFRRPHSAPVVDPALIRIEAALGLVRKQLCQISLSRRFRPRLALRGIVHGTGAVMVRTRIRPVHRCRCRDCRAEPRGATAKLHAGINRVITALDERNRRRFAGLWAAHLGWGGIQRVAEITGLSRPTIARGRRELETGGGSTGRVRRPGGGRPRTESRFPGASAGARSPRR